MYKKKALYNLRSIVGLLLCNMLYKKILISLKNNNLNQLKTKYKKIIF